MPESGGYASEEDADADYPYDYDEYAYEDEAYDDDVYAQDWDDPTDTDPADDPPQGAPMNVEPATAAIAAAGGDRAAGTAVEHPSYPGLIVEDVALRRTAGGTVTLSFAVVNQSADTVELSGDSVFEGAQPVWCDWDLRRAGLVDMLSGKRYTPMVDDEENVLVSKGTCDDHQLAAGERRELWARFAKVPSGLRALSVDIPGFPPIDGVPIVGG